MGSHLPGLIFTLLVYCLGKVTIYHMGPIARHLLPKLFAGHINYCFNMSINWRCPVYGGLTLVLTKTRNGTAEYGNGIRLLPRARMREAGLSNGFCPSVCQSVCQSVIKILG